jgi:hypothetical protein
VVSGNVVEADWVVNHNLGTGGTNQLGNRNGWGVAQVIAVWLEGSTEYQNLLTGQVCAQLAVQQVNHASAATQVYLVNVLQEGNSRTNTQFLGARHESTNVLGQASATKANAGSQEFLANAVVVANGLG